MKNAIEKRNNQGTKVITTPQQNLSLTKTRNTEYLR